MKKEEIDKKLKELEAKRKELETYIDDLYVQEALITFMSENNIKELVLENGTKITLE